MVTIATGLTLSRRRLDPFQQWHEAFNGARPVELAFCFRQFSR